jgi:hypothetical protein
MLNGRKAEHIDGRSMKYLVELVFGIGFFGLGAIALTFFLRFLLLTWAVRLAGRIAQSILGFTKRLCLALIFIFGPALLGAFIIGFALESGANLAAGGGNASADPTQPILLAFLSFFAIIAFRAWQLNLHRKRDKHPSPQPGRGICLSPADGLIADAWARAIKLAPAQRHELLDAQAVCSALCTVVKLDAGNPDGAMIETAELIRSYLPPFIDSIERRLSGAQVSERQSIIDEMVKFLKGFADRAQRDMQVGGFGADAGDSAMRAHLTVQLFGRNGI